MIARWWEDGGGEDRRSYEVTSRHRDETERSERGSELGRGRIRAVGRRRGKSWEAGQGKDGWGGQRVNEEKRAE